MKLDATLRWTYGEDGGDVTWDLQLAEVVDGPRLMDAHALQIQPHFSLSLSGLVRSPWRCAGLKLNFKAQNPKLPLLLFPLGNHLTVKTQISPPTPPPTQSGSWAPTHIFIALFHIRPQPKTILLSALCLCLCSCPCPCPCPNIYYLS